MSRRKMTASSKLMAQGYSGTRRMKFTQMFALGVNAAVGPNGGCCLVNIPLLNNGLSTATNFYRLVGPQNVQPTNFNLTRSQYQEYTITAVRAKAILPRNPTELNAGTQQQIAGIEWAYDDTEQIASGQDPTALNLAAYTNYQAGPVPLSYQSTRYLKTAAVKKRLGINYCEGSDTAWTYYNQLPATTCPSLYLRLMLTGFWPANTVMASLELTYYYTFRGLDFGQNP